MTALDPADARRLKSSLARLASPHDGEIVAAAKAAERILAKAGLRSDDLDVRPALPPPETSRRREHPRADHRYRANDLLTSGYPWTPWSRKFLRSIAEWSAPLSSKQSDILDQMEAEAAQHSTGGRG